MTTIDLRGLSYKGIDFIRLEVQASPLALVYFAQAGVESSLALRMDLDKRIMMADPPIQHWTVDERLEASFPIIDRYLGAP